MEQVDINTNTAHSQNVAENHISKEQRTEESVLWNEHDYCRQENKEPTDTGLGVEDIGPLESPYDEVEAILDNNTSSLSMDSSTLLEVSNVIFEVDEALLSDGILDISNNNNFESDNVKIGDEEKENEKRENNNKEEEIINIRQEEGDEAIEVEEHPTLLVDGEYEYNEGWEEDEGRIEIDDDEENNDLGNENQGRKKKGRKRKYPEQNRDIRKTLKNSNKKFINQKGEMVLPKTFRDYHCKCKCNEKVPVEIRMGIFNKFWKLSNYNSQTMFICSQVSERPVKRKRATDSEKRQFSREYHLNDEVVCKQIFMQTLRISSNRINTALKKIKQDDMVDKRGSHGGHNKLEDHKTQEVINHIRSIPKYKSHYCRSSTETLFLPTDMTLAKMYDLYKNSHENPVSRSKYTQIFYTKFNLKRKALKKDTCSTCDSFQAKLQSSQSNEEKEKIEADHNAHLIAVETARKLMKSDLEEASKSDIKETLTFDLQKTLPLPKIPTNIVYYKRQIMLYNCGIHSGKTNKGYFHVWVEGTAGRGAQEVASCLKKHIESECQNVKELVLWADSCGGQNRNIKMTLMLKYIMQNHPTLEKVTLRFPIPGHSFLPNDSEFGDVECHIRTHQCIYTDKDYITIMQDCRKKNKLVVNKMASEDFFSSSKLEKSIVNRKKDTTGEKINWFSFREIEVKKAAPFSIYFKTEFDKDQNDKMTREKTKMILSG